MLLGCVALVAGVLAGSPGIAAADDGTLMVCALQAEIVIEPPLDLTPTPTTEHGFNGTATCVGQIEGKR